jgi:WD40 repeat protein
VWDLEAGKELRQVDGHGEWVETVALSPDGKLALTGGGNVMRLWEVETGKEVRAFPGHRFAVTSVAFTPDGQGAWSAGYDGSIRLWDVETGKERQRITGHSEWVWSVDPSRDGRRLLTAGGGAQQSGQYVAGKDFTIRLWALPAAQAAKR